MYNSTPVTVNRHSSLDDRKNALQVIYNQVLERQPFISERKQLAHLESDFLKNKIGVRRFLKELGHSPLYLNAFYYHSSNPKFLENCFKHFLGRSISDGEEMRAYTDVLTRSGVIALINAILDSEEYRKHFGCFTVPYHRAKTYYESPNVYLESTVICEEHYGQRGWSVPTLYWHQLGLDCDSGSCKPTVKRHISEAKQASTWVEPEGYLPQSLDVLQSRPAEPAQDELMDLLWGLEATVS